MTDVVARQREPKEQQQQQQGSGQGEGKPIGAHNHNQSDQQSNGLVEQRQHSSADQGRIRQQEDKIIEELKRIAKSCQSDVKPSMSTVRSDLERIARTISQP